MFVLLEHCTPAAGRRDATPADVHWDFLVEVPGQERLAAWRLARNPADDMDEIPAERIQDHRRLYLDYEGEISGGRGSVRRIDRGQATVERLAADELTVVLDGRHLRGRFAIDRSPGGTTVFRRCRTSL